jgi:hypothetical protein
VRGMAALANPCGSHRTQQVATALEKRTRFPSAF